MVGAIGANCVPLGSGQGPRNGTGPRAQMLKEQLQMQQQQIQQQQQTQQQQQVAQAIGIGANINITA